MQNHRTKYKSLNCSINSWNISRIWILYMLAVFNPKNAYTEKNGLVLEVLVRSNNLTLVEKLISKLISKIYKTPKFTLHILKLKMWLIFPSVSVRPILILYFVHLTEETKGDSTLPPNFLQSVLQTWKPRVLSFTLGSIFPFNLEVRGFFRQPEFEGKVCFSLQQVNSTAKNSNQKPKKNKSELNICIYESHNMEAIASVYQVISMSAKGLCKCTANLLCH